MVHRRSETREDLGSQEFFQKTLDSLLSHIAILADDGTILAVNAPWRAYATQNGGVETLCGPATNYLRICEAATGPCSEEAQAVAAGIRGVVAGRLPDFVLEYPCHEPTGPRWFSIRITRFLIRDVVRVVVAHEDITQRKLAELRLRDANLILAREASTDVLTGIGNRRCFDRSLEREWAAHRRRHAALSVVLMDVDFFKRYNDSQGHLAGDECLREVARTILANLTRPGDFGARYGGEEFAAILPHTDGDGAVEVAGRIAEGFRARKLPHPGSPLGPYVTLSFGCATAVPSRDMRFRDLVDQADRALYRAKAEGRDRVVHHALGSVEADVAR